jgi:CBS domain containing-hemolysin-like protein
LDSLPLLAAMFVLMGLSAFFSASEAALFSLRAPDRAALRTGNRGQRTAYHLLSDPDRLLSAVLFWNLLTNIVYFSLASRVGLQLQKRPDSSATLVFGFTFGALLAIIFLSEMLPKSLAVLTARSLSALVSLPLSLAVRILDPLMPALRLINLLSRRLIWPSFQPEPYLDVNDLERAIELSTTDAQLIDQERSVLTNVISLSEMRVDECMRPRSQLITFRPPVRWSDVQAQPPPSGYLFVTDADGEEIVSAIELQTLPDIPENHLEYFTEPVIYVPWCATVADVVEQMEAKERDAVAVVNELGETIGAMTRKDLQDVVFTSRSSRSERLLNRLPIQQLSEGLWQVTGMTNLRVLEDHFEITLPETPSVTVAGVLQESLQRLPAVGDLCDWGPWQFEVTEILENGQVLVNLRRTDREDKE